MNGIRNSEPKAGALSEAQPLNQDLFSGFLNTGSSPIDIQQFIQQYRTMLTKLTQQTVRINIIP